MTSSVLKETFFKIPPKKQDHIMRCALKEFAKRGLSGTNILDVAKRAKISVGSLYTYVDSKDELYVAVAERLVNQMVEQMEAFEINGSFLDNVCNMFEYVRDNGRKQTDAVRFYFDMMTEMGTTKIKDITYLFESKKYDLFMRVIDNAIETGEIKPDIDREVLAFVIDTYLQTYQFAITTTHYRNKSKIYFGANNPEELGQKICDQFEISIGNTIFADKAKQS